MSQMSNPYAALQRDDLMIERKVSVMAIVALVVAILGFLGCFVPGLAGLGALLGVAALVIISQSDGRVGGRGMAIAAIVLGLLMTIFQIGIAVGVRQALSKANAQLFVPLGGIVAEAETKDLTRVRALLTKPAADRLEQADLDAFADGVKAELGAFKGVPEGMVPLFRAYSKLGPLIQQYQNQGGSNDVIPLPVEFEKGLALLAVQVDNAGNAPPTPNTVPVINAKIVTADGKSFTLYPGRQTDKAGGFPARPSASPADEQQTEGETEDVDEPAAGEPQQPAAPATEPTQP